MRHRRSFTSVRGRAVRRQRGLVGIASSVLILVAGCSTFEAKYFIEAEETRPTFGRPHSSFIRLDLNGWTFFTLSKFEKGWYDRDAVDSLFSTVVSRVADQSASPPATPPTPKTTMSLTGEQSTAKPGGTDDTTKTSAAKPAGSPQAEKPADQPVLRTFHVFGPAGEEPNAGNKRLVVFATSNPDEIVDQIMTSVRTQELASQVGSLLAAPRIREAQSASTAAGIAAKRHETILADVGQVLDWLVTADAADSLPGDTVRRQLNNLTKTIEGTSVTAGTGR